MNADATDINSVEIDKPNFLFFLSRRLYLAALIISTASKAKAKIITRLPKLTAIFMPERNPISINTILINCACKIPVKFAKIYTPASIENFDNKGCFTVLLARAESSRKLEKIVINEPIMPTYCANCSSLSSL